MTKIRALVAEDSPTVRRRLRDALSSDPDFTVVGEAENGQVAFEMCRDLRPDVVTLDMMMPVMTGLEATEHIMAHCPTPILIVSASTNRGELFRTYEALAAGALDVLEKPTGDEPDGEWERKLLMTIRVVARIKVITHVRARLGSLGRPAATLPPAAVPTSASQRYGVIAIGASTGGPAAIVDVLTSIPSPLPAPILLVLHIDEPFGSAFADWLDE
jgi:two-component system chemotaxis response regulator CheB